MMKLRPATTDDARRLFDWRNDPLTRAMSNNTDPVAWDRHVEWLSKRLARDHPHRGSQRENPHLYIFELDGEPVGTVRLDGDEISYTVAPEHRQKGVAKTMLTEAFRQFGPKRAEIKPENVASIKAARAAGHEVALVRTQP